MILVEGKPCQILTTIFGILGITGISKCRAQSHKSYKSQYRPRLLGFLGLPRFPNVVHNPTITQILQIPVQTTIFGILGITGRLAIKYRNESHNPTNHTNPSTDHDYWDSWDYRDFQLSCAITQILQIPVKTNYFLITIHFAMPD